MAIDAGGKFAALALWASNALEEIGRGKHHFGGGTSRGMFVVGVEWTVMISAHKNQSFQEAILTICHMRHVL